MEHLMAAPPGGGGPQPLFAQMPRYIARDSNTNPAANDIYVGQIPVDVDTQTLHALFSQFGEIERVFEGHRGMNNGMKWAFISFIHAQDAANVLHQSGKIGLGGSILNIRPRDRTTERERRPARRTNPARNMHEQFRPDPRLTSPHHNNNGHAFLPRSPEPMDNSWSPYPLLSKTLTVANLPPEYTPKDLYGLFSDIGQAEGAFVYAFPDAKGRRVGEVAMASYLLAQKSLEHMDGRYIDGYALEVSYKPAIPIPQGTFNVPSVEHHIDYPPVPTQIEPPPRHLWSAPPAPNPFAAPSIPPPQMPPNFAMWPFVNPQVEVHRVHPNPPPIPRPQLVAPEPNPPPPYSALPPIPETDDQPQDTPMTTPPVVPPKAPGDPCNLFIKNLDDEVIVTTHDLETLFSPYGTITSTFLATHAPKDDMTNPVSKGFGFVAFSRAQEAELAKNKVHGLIVGRKKVFVSYAEKKDDRQMRLKMLFANMEKLAEEIKEASGRGQVKEGRGDKISRRGILRGQDGLEEEIRAAVMPLQSPTRQGSSPKGRGSPIRKQIRQTGRKKTQQSSIQKVARKEYEGPVIDIDFYEDFPPLPKSVKPTQSPTLQKIAQASSVTKEPKEDQENDPVASERELIDPAVFQVPATDVQGLSTPHRRNTLEVDMNDIRANRSLQGTPAVPRAPPPSSAGLSTAGNTAPSTPSAIYSHPRFTLHDHLVHANASLATLQEGRRIMIPRSAVTSPLLGPNLIYSEYGRKWNEDGDTPERIDSLDTTIGASAFAEMKVTKEWMGASLVET